MAIRKSPGPGRPRELRRRVVVPARLRLGASWSDTLILNVSSRGLMIRTARPASRGTVVEVRRGDHVIAARVVWRDGARAGLEASERVPVEEIVTQGQGHALQLTAGVAERRMAARGAEHGRMCGRAVEFAGLVTILVSLAGAGTAMVEAAFARPLAEVLAALAP